MADDDSKLLAGFHQAMLGIYTAAPEDQASVYSGRLSQYGERTWRQGGGGPVAGL